MTDLKEPTFPKINLNGTDKKVLFDEMVDALVAVQNAQTVLAKITVHGRDFPDTESFNQYRDEHRARFLKIIDISNELHEVAYSINQQGA